MATEVGGATGIGVVVEAVLADTAVGWSPPDESSLTRLAGSLSTDINKTLSL